MKTLEIQIGHWRAYVSERADIDHSDIDELETHLRDQVADLHAAGLSEEEAFVIAVKRIGDLDELSREFAHEYSGRLWKQLVLQGDSNPPDAPTGLIDALAFALAAAATAQMARLASGIPDAEPHWLLRNLSLVVLPFLAAFFARRRQLNARQWLAAASAFSTAGLLINLYPFPDGSTTELLAAAHLPVALWFVVGYAYMGGTFRSHERRMDFVRFTGEWFIYFVLIALGGGVLVGLTALILEPVSSGLAETVALWILPSGAAGAVIISAWLVESKQRVVENMAPVLTMVFTPLFAVMLAGAAIVYAATGWGGAFDRELLGVFDALMVVVLGLVLYGMSARDPSLPPGWMDRVQLVAVAGALVLDVMVLTAMLGRIGELGFTPNRSVALGLNLVLLVNLVGTAWLSMQFLTERGTFLLLERWQTSYLPAFAVWATAVVMILPLAFAFA